MSTKAQEPVTPGQSPKELDPNLLNELGKAINKVLDEKQTLPHQYVVAIKVKETEELIGYHLSTFNQLTEHKLQAKRYSGKDNKKQLEIIANNLKSVLEITEEKAKEKMFGEVMLDTKKQYKGYKFEDLCLEAEYLDEDIPKQNHRIHIL